MKKGFLLITGIFYCTFVIAQTKTFIDQPYIEVNGQADTLIVPNEIYIQIILSEKDAKDRVSLEELELRLVASLKNLGIDTEKNLSLSDLASNFRIYLLREKVIIKTKAYTLKVTDAATASRVFVALEENGISNAVIERISHSELATLKNSMRTKAIIDARQRAISLVEPLQQQLGPAIHITDTDFSSSNGLAGKSTGLRIRGTTAFSANSQELPQIDFEKIRIEAGVAVKFMLR